MQAPTLVLAYLVVEMISGAVAGCLAKIIGDALVPTGALDAFPIAAHRVPDV
jgi:ABC-type thiamin/hydroxymethylpyrimidine transport system permease subunit